MKFSDTCEICGKPSVAGGTCSLAHHYEYVDQQLIIAERMGKLARIGAIVALVLALLSMFINAVF